MMVPLSSRATYVLFPHQTEYFFTNIFKQNPLPVNEEYALKLVLITFCVRFAGFAIAPISFFARLELST